MTFFSPSRIWVITTNTFTQLVRMKVFYFLIAFAILSAGLNLLEFDTGATDTSEQKLRSVKSLSFFIIRSFSIVFAIAATAILIPKDIEERTLYTILCKPVPRLDYLTGKFLGVFLLMGVAIAVMSLLLNGIIHYHTVAAMIEETARFQAAGASEQTIALRMQELSRYGVTWSLQYASLAILMEATLIAGVALLISTFSSSTLFTIVSTVVIFFIGHFQADAREYYLSKQSLGETDSTTYLTQLVAILFPDLQLFGVSDGLLKGKTISLAQMGQLALTMLLQCGMYLALSWFAFRKKEF